MFGEPTTLPRTLNVQESDSGDGGGQGQTVGRAEDQNRLLAQPKGQKSQLPRLWDKFVGDRGSPVEQQPIHGRYACGRRGHLSHRLFGLQQLRLYSPIYGCSNGVATRVRKSRRESGSPGWLTAGSKTICSWQWIIRSPVPISQKGQPFLGSQKLLLVVAEEALWNLVST